MITAISPLDGRYQHKVSDLSAYFSEFALIKNRLIVEVSWLMALSAEKAIKELPPFNKAQAKALEDLVRNFDEKQARLIKTIEKRTNHDVKAVEYYMKEKLAKTSLKPYLEFIHFACTSEDINNLAYGLMLSGAIQDVILPSMKGLNKKIVQLARSWKAIPLLALTHGQPATPTTVGKELKIFAERLERQIKIIKKQEYLGKINGASGNFNAHVVAYSKVNWVKLSAKFIKNLGLTPNMHTTQIEPHDYQSEAYDAIARFNTILTDLNRDIWGYISRGVFKQNVIKGEIGSSTMPHKVNPIDFENSEGNLGLANAILRHLSEKLPVSRYQRDLTDSTVQRNIGVGLGYSLLAYTSTLKGLNKLGVNKAKCKAELSANWALMAEPIQTVLRKYSVPNAYELLKELTRGQEVNKKIVQDFVEGLNIPAEGKAQLLKLTPANYIGLANKL